MAEYRFSEEGMKAVIVLAENVWPETLIKLESFDMKEDVLIVSYPKTGTIVITV